MRRQTLVSVLALLCLLSATQLASAGTTSYYSTTDPGTARPPAAPWVAAGAGGVPFPAAVEGKIWIGKDNVVLFSQKDWTVKLNGPDAQKFGLSKVSAYLAGPPITAAPVAASTGITDTVGPPATRTFTFMFKPQPDWEVVELVRTLAAARGGGGTTVTSYSHCSGPVWDGNTLLVEEAFFGHAADDTLQITQVTIFPEVGPIAPSGHSFTPPPGSGDWISAIIFTDPEGNPQPQGGVTWTAPAGEWLAAEDVYGFTLEMEGEADAAYSFYAFDNAPDGGLQYYRLVGPTPVPAVSEWGLVVMTLSVLVAGTIAMSRRRKAKMA